MIIFILSQHFPPEPPPIAHMMKELAHHLAKQKHEVHVLTGFPSYPTGGYEGYNRKIMDTRLENGIYIHRFWSTIYGSDFIRRILFFLSWSYSVRILGRRLPKPDVIYVEIPPPSSAISAIKLAQYFKCPVAARIQDIHPDSAIASGFIRNPLLIRYLKKKETQIYTNLDKILVIGSGFYNLLQKKGVSINKLSVCPNWIDLSEIRPKTKYPNPVREHFEISREKRIILYAGTMGRSHGTSIFLDSAKLSQNIKGMENTVFVFVGQGYERYEIETLIQNENISNVLLFDPVERKDLSDMLSMADITVVSLKPGFGNLSVPSKVLGYMAVGRPVIALVDESSDTANIINESKCGEILKPDDSTALADVVQRWIVNEELCESVGKSAREYCEKYIRQNVLMEKVTTEIESFV